MLLFSTKHQGSEEEGIICCMTLLLYACCTGSGSIVPGIHCSAMCEAVPLCNGGYSFWYVTLVLCFSHTQHYDFFFFFIFQIIISLYLAAATQGLN